MAVHKGKRAAGERSGRLSAALEAVPYVLALACLALYALGTPFPVPRFALPARSYALSGLGADEALASAAAGPFGSVELRLDGSPTMAEVAAAREHYRSTGMPVVLKAGPGDGGPVAAWSMPLCSEGSAIEITILVDREAASGTVAILVDGAEAATFQAVPPDRRVKLAIPRGESTMVSKVEVIAGGRSTAIPVAARGSAEPRILLASSRTGVRSAVEALFPVRRVALSELGSAGFHAYDLVVLDGPDLRGMGQGLEAALADYVERGAGSLLLVADSPEIGGPGDAPELERLLPVDLAPRSLSRLPDVAMAVAIDASGSMYGEKLSLAKAVGLELVGNLKPSDRAGILLFDDGHAWLRPLGPVASLDAVASLEPLRAGGGTRLYPAIDAGLDALADVRMPERKLVVVSDGLTEPADFDALVAKAFGAGIPITTMAVGDEYDRALLTRLAAGSGGRFYRVKNAWDVPSLIIEDRRSVSRTVFAAETVEVVDVAGRPAGSIGGMARLSPKPDALAFYSSAAGDPLLAARRVGSRSAIVYSSDLYGRYGRDFLSRPATLSTLRAVIGGTLDDEAPAATLSCTADGITVSIAGTGLAAPRLAAADAAGRLEAEARFKEVAPGRFAARFDPVSEGVYTLLIEDRGRTLARFQAAATPGIGAGESDAAAEKYRPPAWGLARGRAWWLSAFFVCTLVATLASRLLGRSRIGRRSAGSAAAGASLILAACLFAPAVAAAQTSAGSTGSSDPGLSLDLSAPRPWAFNRALIAAEGGLAGDVGVRGTLDDGTEVELFIAEGVSARETTATWYGDGRLVSLTAYERGRDGHVRSATATLGAGYASAAAAGRLTRLSFPYRPGFGSPPRGAAVLADSSPDALARTAVETLFRPPGRRASALVLAAWALAACAAALWDARWAARKAPSGAGDSRRRRIAAASFALASLALAATLAATIRPSAELYSAASSEAGIVELMAATERRDGYPSIDWTGQKPGGPIFVAVRSPIEASVPVSAFDRFEEVRFRTPPLVMIRDDGTSALAPAPFAMAWGTDE